MLWAVEQGTLLMRRSANIVDRRKYAAKLRGAIRNFLVREDGSLVVFSLFLIPIMLILCGMAVDLMRYEGRRILIQDMTDHASLLAANVSFTKEENAAEAVRDYFAKAGLEEYLDGDPIVSPAADGAGRTVTVNASQSMDTLFLHMVGIDTLGTAAQAVASQGYDSIEISLVLNVSGTMNDLSSDSPKPKIKLLKEAAEEFLDIALQKRNENRVSVSIVPYSSQVSITKDMFDRLNTDSLHDFSHCLEFEESDFSSAGLDLNKQYHQGQHVDIIHRAHNDITRHYRTPTCPFLPGNVVTPISENLDVLKQQIDALDPRGETSMHLGMKWGLALLDPSANKVVFGNTSGAGVQRPVPYSEPGDLKGTLKVIVLMTDGANSGRMGIDPVYYSSPSHYAHWARYPFVYWRENQLSNNLKRKYGQHHYEELISTVTQANAQLQLACDAARAVNVQVFTIAFEATGDGDKRLSDCATSLNHHFRATGSNLESKFRTIADQIGKLGLTE